MKFDTSSIKREFGLLPVIWKMAKGNHLSIIVSMILQIVMSVLPAAVTFFVQNSLADDLSLNMLFELRNLMYVLAFAFFSLIVGQAISVMLGYAMANVKRNTEIGYIAKLSSIDFDTVHDKMNNRDVLSLTRESEMLSSLIPMVYRSFIQAPITIFAFSFLMIVVSVKLTLVIFLLVVVVLICSMFLRKVVKTTNRKLMARIGDLHQTYSDWIRGHRVALFYNALKLTQSTLVHLVDETCQLTKKKISIGCTQRVVTETITYLVVLLFLFVVRDMDAHLRWQAIISFPTAILFIRNEAMKISSGYIQLAGTESSIFHLVSVLNRDKSAEPSLEWNEPIRSIDFVNVCFAYNEKNRVLTDASWNVVAGTPVALVGNSGAGKSTSFDLIATLRRPQSGQILFNGKEVSLYSSESILRRLACVEQEPFVFEGTYLENIALGNTVDNERILHYCRELRLDHLIGDESALTRQISEKVLSVGEKQRMAFIRALLKSPDVILMDEMSSNVDSETKTIMLDYVRKIAEDRIVIVISHDPVVINSFTHIAQLSDGKIRTIR